MDERLAREAARLYRLDFSLYDIAEKLDVSYGKARRLVLAAGLTLRAPGRTNLRLKRLGRAG